MNWRRRRASKIAFNNNIINNKKEKVKHKFQCAEPENIMLLPNSQLHSQPDFKRSKSKAFQLS